MSPRNLPSALQCLIKNCRHSAWGVLRRIRALYSPSPVPELKFQVGTATPIAPPSRKQAPCYNSHHPRATKSQRHHCRAQSSRCAMLNGTSRFDCHSSTLLRQDSITEQQDISDAASTNIPRMDACFLKHLPPVSILANRYSGRTCQPWNRIRPLCIPRQNRETKPQEFAHGKAQIYWLVCTTVPFF